MLFALSFPPADLGVLAWVALVPLLLSIHDLEPKQALRLGFLGGFIGFFLVVSWIRVYGLPVWLLLSAYLALQCGAFAGAHRWIAQGRSPWVGVASVPLLWTSLEFLRSIGPFGFPWALLGVTQHAFLPAIQVARIAGVFGVSFLVSLGSAFVFAVLQRRLFAAAVPAALIALAVAWGGRQIDPVPAASLQVAAVQPNVAQGAKFDPSHAREIMVGLEQLVRRASKQNPKLVIFPETAVPVNLFGPGGVLPEVGRWANAARMTVIASSLENGESNTAVAVAPSGQATDRYDKVRLVAFGEAGIRPGNQHKPLWTPEGRVGIAICFESIFPDVARTLTRNGAEILAVITNDGVIATNSPVDRWAGPEQHAAHAVFRAVETGQWVIRAANIGLTQIIDPAGRIRAALPRGQADVLAGRVAMVRAPTPYAARGDVFAWAALIVTGIVALPRAIPWLAARSREQVFQQAAAATALPALATWLLLHSRAPSWLWVGVLLTFAAIFSVLRRTEAWVFLTRRTAAVAGLGIGVVLLLWLLITTAYRAQGIPIILIAPGTGWQRFALAQLIVAVAVEGWLRGYAFSALAESLGTGWAIALATFLGMMMQTGFRPEAYAWAMVTGAAFGLIRAKTGNVAGLVVAHTLGNILMSAIVPVR